MPREHRRKCPHCGQWYDPDPRNRWHQRYCAAPACRQASKAASQGRWRASPRGRNYFRGTANPIRVQTWRKAHPGYWRRHPRKRRALQDHCAAQVLVPPEDTPTLNPRALQDLLTTQGLTLTGLVAHLTGSALQEIIAGTTRRLVLLGQQVLEARKTRRGAVSREPAVAGSNSATANGAGNEIFPGGVRPRIDRRRPAPESPTRRRPQALVPGAPHGSKPG